MLNQAIVAQLTDVEDAVASASEPALDELEVRLLVILGKIRTRRDQPLRDLPASRPACAAAQPPTGG